MNLRLYKNHDVITKYYLWLLSHFCVDQNSNCHWIWIDLFGAIYTVFLPSAMVGIFDWHYLVNIFNRWIYWNSEGEPPTYHFWLRRQNSYRIFICIGKWFFHIWNKMVGIRRKHTRVSIEYFIDNWRQISINIYLLFLEDTTTFILVWLLLDLPTTFLEPIYNSNCSKYWRIKRKVKICRKIVYQELYVHITYTDINFTKVNLFSLPICVNISKNVIT